MEQQYIHVRCGLTDGVFPVIELIEDGIMAGMYEFRIDANKVGYTHKKHCTLVNADGKDIDTDWRGYLKNHWDKERDFLRTDCLEGFMKIFMRAYTNYINKKGKQERIDMTRDEVDGQRTSNSYVQLSLFPGIIESIVYEPKKRKEK